MAGIDTRLLNRHLAGRRTVTIRPSAEARTIARGAATGASLIGVVALAATLAAAHPALADPPPGACNGAGVIAGALPAVVNVSVVAVVADQESAPGGAPHGAHFEFSAGSGAIIDPSGVIVTNKHVIENAARISVTFADRSMVPAQLIAASSLVDLAVLKVSAPEPLPTLAFGNSDAVEPGEPVFAIGNPLGLGTSVSRGVVSALDRDLMRTPFDEFIQTDAPINPGNSGGPLIDCTGRMIGINTALLSNNKTLGSIGIGFAMPSSSVAYIANKLRAPGDAPPNWIGLHAQDLTLMLARLFNDPAITGAIVTAIDRGSPAAHAGMVAGDIITRVNGYVLPDARAILRMITMTPPGQPISLSILRGGRATETTIHGQPWPEMVVLHSQVLASPDAVAKAEALGIGLHLTPLTEEDRKRYGTGDVSGVLVDRVDENSQAYDRNIQAGEVITSIGAVAAETPDQVMDALKPANVGPGGSIALLVWRKAGPRWITLCVGNLDVADLVAPESPLAVRNAATRAR